MKSVVRSVSGIHIPMEFNKNVPNETFSYCTLVVSKIPVYHGKNGFSTTPLWALDINANAKVVNCIRLVCPVVDGDYTGNAPLDQCIEVIEANAITSTAIVDLVVKSEVVELPGNYDWFGSALTRRVMRIAQRNNKLTVLGISSNRAKTNIMNAVGKPLPSRIRAWLRAQSIQVSQRYLVSKCDAVRIVGMGLYPLVAERAKAILIETASWISLKDISLPRKEQFEPVSIVIASRLEPMKGVAVGIKAVAKLVAEGREVTLNVIGVGAEEEKLKELVKSSNISKNVRFSGQLSYPEPFFEAIRGADYVMLTNLNDEQPRLIFDAIAQGAIPVCPRKHAYEELRLDPRLLYEQGSAENLMERLQHLMSLPEETRREIREDLRNIAELHTLESMHVRRRNWVISLLSKNKP